MRTKPKHMQKSKIKSQGVDKVIQFQLIINRFGSVLNFLLWYQSVLIEVNKFDFSCNQRWHWIIINIFDGYCYSTFICSERFNEEKIS